jgi:predicted dinucleotide-binding enzyme
MATPAFAAITKKLKIGFIGAGRIGGNLAKLWADAGYAVMLSARDLGPVKELAAKIGPNVSVGSPAEAVAFGDVIVMSVPYESVPQVSHDYGPLMKGKIVLDTCNPKRETYAALTPEQLALGTGIIDQKLLPGTRLVKAFNTVNFGALKTEGHRSGELAGVPLSADDAKAMDVAKTLVTDAGFEPVVAGNLATAQIYDSYTPFHANGITATEVRRLLKEKPKPVFTDK